MPDPDASRASSSSSLSCWRPGWGRQVGGVGVGVLAQHAEQPPHLGEAARAVSPIADELLAPAAGMPGSREPGRLGLHGDHRDVVGDDVVQLTRDACALAASGVLQQVTGGDLPGGVDARAPRPRARRAIPANAAAGAREASEHASARPLQNRADRAA